MVEKRKGELLGPPEQGRRTDLQTSPHAGEFSVPSQTASKYRALARWWDELLWPVVRDAKVSEERP